MGTSSDSKGFIVLAAFDTRARFRWFFAKRMKAATTELKASHVSMLLQLQGGLDGAQTEVVQGNRAVSKSDPPTFGR